MKIILIRHGKPTSANNAIVGAVEYTKWIKRYNASDVDMNSRPQCINEHYNGFYTLASDLKRAIHSTRIYQGKLPDLINSLYREMEIPRYKLPFHLSTWHWVYLCRVLWMLGCKGPFESFKQAKRRADVAADNLIAIAKQQEHVVLFGHGFMNRYIRKSLVAKGWQLKAKSSDFWGVTHLEN